jgi:hypothetical protein
MRGPLPVARQEGADRMSKRSRGFAASGTEGGYPARLFFLASQCGREQGVLYKSHGIS